MRDQLIIRLTELPSTQVSWLKLSSTADTFAIENGELSEAAVQAVASQVIVLLPANVIWQGAVSVPTKNKQRMLTAIPYMLEEELASDVDSLHFAVGKQASDGRVDVAAVSRELLESWLQMLTEAGITADVITSELEVVATEADVLSVVIEDDHFFVRSKGFTGFSSENENLELMLSMAVKEQEDNAFSCLRVQHDERRSADASALSAIFDDNINIDYVPLTHGLLSLIPKDGLGLASTINFLQGPFSRKEQLGKLWRPWRFAASLVGVLFLLQLGLSVTESTKLETEYLALKQKSEAIYRDAFPDAKRIVNVKAQMQQKLEALKGVGLVKELNFLSLLADSGMAFKQTSGLVLRSVRYKNGTLDVELEVPSLQVLDQLKQNLQKKSGLTVEIQSAASRKNIVQGRLQIKGAV